MRFQFHLMVSHATCPRSARHKHACTTQQITTESSSSLLLLPLALWTSPSLLLCQGGCVGRHSCVLCQAMPGLPSGVLWARWRLRVQPSRGRRCCVRCCCIRCLACCVCPCALHQRVCLPYMAKDETFGNPTPKKRDGIYQNELFKTEALVVCCLFRAGCFSCACACCALWRKMAEDESSIQMGNLQLNSIVLRNICIPLTPLLFVVCCFRRVFWCQPLGLLPPASTCSLQCNHTPPLSRFFTHTGGSEVLSLQTCRLRYDEDGGRLFRPPRRLPPHPLQPHGSSTLPCVIVPSCVTGAGA